MLTMMLKRERKKIKRRRGGEGWRKGGEVARDRYISFFDPR